ncbi:hypothetical protein ES703_14878 [subsurface metagenome]
MKKLINRKLYDTDNAINLANWDNGLGYSDFRFIEESLYRTNSGQLFLSGRSGALTDYGESCSGEKTCGDNIVLFSEDDAIDWLEHHQCIKEIEQHFPNAITEG